jgi:hypothetical protein
MLLLKSKNQRTTSYVLGGIGVAAIPVAMAGLSKITLEEGFGESGSVDHKQKYSTVLPCTFTKNAN